MVHAVDYSLLNKLRLCLRPPVVHLRFKANFVRSTLNFYIRLLTRKCTHEKTHNCEIFTSSAIKLHKLHNINNINSD